MITNFNRFINENNIIDKALSIIDETEIDKMFKIYLNTYEEKIDLLKYIAEQGQGLNDEENKQSLYKATCRVFTKKLTDAAIEAFPL